MWVDAPVCDSSEYLVHLLWVQDAGRIALFCIAELIPTINLISTIQSESPIKFGRLIQ